MAKESSLLLGVLIYNQGQETSYSGGKGWSRFPCKILVPLGGLWMKAEGGWKLHPTLSHAVLCRTVCFQLCTVLGDTLLHHLSEGRPRNCRCDVEWEIPAVDLGIGTHSSQLCSCLWKLRSCDIVGWSCDIVTGSWLWNFKYSPNSQVTLSAYGLWFKMWTLSFLSLPPCLLPAVTPPMAHYYPFSCRPK